MATRMNDAEAIMWAVESDPFLRSDFMNIMLLDAPPDPVRLRAGIGRVLASYPPLRQRVVRPPLGIAPPEWADDPEFDLDYHFRRVAVPPPGSHRQMLDLAALLATAPLDRARPLWEVTVVEGLEHGRAAVLQRVHHSLTDGVGGMKLLRNLLERTPGEAPDDAGAPDPRVWRHPEIFSPAEASLRPLDGWTSHRGASGRPTSGSADDAGWPADRLSAPIAAPLAGLATALAFRFNQGLSAARRGFEMAGSLATRSSDELRALADVAGRTARSVADQALVSGGALSPLFVDRSLTRHFETLSLDLSAVRSTVRSLDGTRNALFVAGVTGALRTYHEGMGAPCDALRMAVPVSLRGGRGPTGGNHFAPARVVVSLGPKDPVERLARTRAALDALSAEPGLLLTESLAGILNLVPGALLVPALRAQARTVDFATSIVPGLRAERYMAGSRVLASWPMGPRLGCAVNLTQLTCGERLDLGVNLDPAAVTDADAFMQCLGESFDDLLAAG